MGDSITPNTATPDVGVNPTPTPVPDSTPATVGRPDVEAITGTPNPADIPAPAGAAVVPSEYTGKLRLKHSQHQNVPLIMESKLDLAALSHSLDLMLTAILFKLILRLVTSKVSLVAF